MTHYCKVCCRKLSLDRFTSAGRRARVCKTCQKLPASEQHRRQSLDELEGFVRQKNLSATNIARLRVLCGSSEAEVVEKALVLLEVARVHPHLSKRVEWLEANQPALRERYEQAFGGVAPAEEAAPEAPPPAN